MTKSPRRWSQHPFHCERPSTCLALRRQSCEQGFGLFHRLKLNPTLLVMRRERAQPTSSTLQSPGCLGLLLISTSGWVTIEDRCSEGHAFCTPEE
mmetsp:Transcript_40601/g.107599  ORF Transcript_40601/g.107599 Transcript_40601/m.107599 type:complete len:95 (-) Transcript_40601:399-683(-)